MPFMPVLKNAAARNIGRFIRAGAAAAGLSAALATAALAGTADGTITKIDETANSLTLSNGKTYKLPGEFNYSGFHAGQKVTVFYDTDPSGAYVNDIEVQGANAADTETPSDDDEGDGLKGEGEDGAATGPAPADNGAAGSAAGDNGANNGNAAQAPAGEQ